MNENQFKTKMAYAQSMRDNAKDQHYWSGYIRGLRRYYHGANFGTVEEHEKYLSLIGDSDESRNRLGQGYSDALEECHRSDAASAMGKKGGSSRTPKKSASSAANLDRARADGKKGGYPRNRPREYYTADRETYTIIDKFTSKKAAQAAIKKYLDEDRDLSQSGTTEYDENFYVILDYEKKEIK